MRLATHILSGYLLVLVIGAFWRYMPFERAAPDIVALYAVYLGLQVHRLLTHTVAGAVFLGYLADLLSGTPKGIFALTAGIMAVLGHLIHQRLLVVIRGRLFTVFFSFFAALVAAFVCFCLRAYVGFLPSSGAELSLLFGSALCTAVFGPLVFAIAGFIDGRFVHRQRSLEGL